MSWHATDIEEALTRLAEAPCCPANFHIAAQRLAWSFIDSARQLQA